MMNQEFVVRRIWEILDARGWSLRQTSLDLGYSDSYFNGIVNGRIDLKVKVLLEFCEYMQITPAEFFGTKEVNQVEKEIFTMIRRMTANDKNFVRDLIRRFSAYRDYPR